MLNLFTLYQPPEEKKLQSKISILQTGEFLNLRIHRFVYFHIKLYPQSSLFVP
jgi:hypothetical protein